MDEIQNPPSSSPTKARSSPPAGDDNASSPSEIWNEENNQMLLNLKLSEKSSDKILSTMNREVVSDQSEDPLNLDVSLAVESSSPAVAGSSRSNPIKNPGTSTPLIESTTTLSTSADHTSWSAQPVGNFNPRVRSTSRGVAITSPPASSVQPVDAAGPSAQVPRWLGVQPNYSTARGPPAVRLPFASLSFDFGRLFQPDAAGPSAQVPRWLGVQPNYSTARGPPAVRLPFASLSFDFGRLFQSGYLHHQGMQPEVPTVRGPVYSGGAHLRGQAHHSRPLVSSGAVILPVEGRIRPRSTGSISNMSIRGPRNSSAAHTGQRSAIYFSMPRFRPVRVRAVGEEPSSQGAIPEETVGFWKNVLNALYFHPKTPSWIKIAVWLKRECMREKHEGSATAAVGLDLGGIKVELSFHLSMVILGAATLVALHATAGTSPPLDFVRTSFAAFFEFLAALKGARGKVDLCAHMADYLKKGI